MAENRVYELLEIIANHEKNDRDFTDEEKLRAAYALNMCMVSVSQIIDYDDIYILEQEYDQILNNLNLEMMPKDEALLKIIKQLLDTITFFRIQEGDKQIVEKEYQQQMKNAIWKAAPNFGLIVAGGNPVSMAVSLASQVGIGYMNYRRAKSENRLEHEKKQWQLQRSAIEQFNGLRRELFDTAWRLADRYKFSDEYRLTEKQIKQYNQILMDPDEIRKYERLTTIKDTFIAYPPFWYHYGNTANHISRNPLLPLSDEARNDYKNRAIEHFEQYWNSNQNGLLREDQLSSACALEHIDLLDINRDADKISVLIDKAEKYSGNSNDILQLCAIAELRIGRNNDAVKLLRTLVNEGYNEVVNAQLLSGLYVNKALHEKDNKSRSDYEILAMRVNPDYLVRLPEIGEKVSEDDLINEFREKQEDLLVSKYDAVIKYSIDDLTIRLNKLIPVPEEDEEYPNSYFSTEELKHRLSDLQDVFSTSFKMKQKEPYLERLSQCDFVNHYFEELNAFFDRISVLNCIRDRKVLQEKIENEIMKNRSVFAEIDKKVEEKTVSFEDMRQLMYLVSGGIFNEFTSELRKQIHTSLVEMNEMSQYAATEKALRDYCGEHGIPETVLLDSGVEVNTDSEHIRTYFGLELLGEYGKSIQKERDKYREIEEIIRKYRKRIGSLSDKAALYFHDSADFNSYFETSKLKEHKGILLKTIAVYDDKSLQNVDLLFTTEGVVPVVRKNILKTMLYETLVDDNLMKKLAAEAQEKVINSGLLGIAFSNPLAFVAAGLAAVDNNAINRIVKELQPMINEIVEKLLS